MPIELINDDCLAVLRNTHHHWCTAFLDPPDGVGMKYNSYDDSTPREEYLPLVRDWLKASLVHADALWLSFNSRWTVDMGSLVSGMLAGTGWKVRPCVQVFTFGQAQQQDLTNGHRPLWRFTRPVVKLLTDPIRIKSWRQENGDKRANPKGKVPDDTFPFPRVTGNSSQRRRWHPTQLHEGLIERCLRLTTPMGGTVLDPFAGTGTVMRVCKRIGFHCTSIEIDRSYCERIAAENGLVETGANSWGA